MIKASNDHNNSKSSINQSQKVFLPISQSHASSNGSSSLKLDASCGSPVLVRNSSCQHFEPKRFDFAMNTYGESANSAQQTEALISRDIAV